ncbi:hypothetical protein IAE35_19745 [Pseudomonas sp. S75]|uniref:DUF6392 family protein n=1 Tax=Pseudomonas sp. S75 TaxID=2767446 RepID=UPI00190E36DB|nr:DUF6392 family protein [Pseudomonas sp. S75]MBK0155577.1 hypothetical protein [Pseudomonas sp. S75]
MKGQLELLINNLGNSYHTLVRLGLVVEHSIRLSEYENSDSLEIESIPGLELVFEPNNCRFETIYIRLRNDENCSLPTYSDQLPNPLDLISDRYDAYNYLGAPLYSYEADPDNRIPAEDTFQLDQQLHSEANLSFQYGADLKPNTIVVSLLDASI